MEVVNRVQNELRGVEDLTSGILGVKSETLSSLIMTQNNKLENYYQQSRFRLQLSSPNIKVRIFSHDHDLMHQQMHYDNSLHKFAQLHLTDISIFVENLPFESIVKLGIGKSSICESNRLFREVLLLENGNQIDVKLWSINSPTISDSEI